MSDLLLEVINLKTHFFLKQGTVKAVDGASFTVRRGQTIGLVGESGCGKSVTAYSILKLIQKPGQIVDGHMIFYRPQDGAEAIDLATLDLRSPELRTVRGREIAMIFQEPMSSLSPVHTIGFQIMEAVQLHFDVNRHEAKQRAIEMLGRVGIPKPEQRLDAYPFQLSGGMRQRAMIAMALSCNPSLLIADEPTTALDVTTQAQILELMLELQRDLGMAIMMITHDLGVVAEICEEVVVMYLGEVVEQASADALFHDPQHPYTRALLNSIPKLEHNKKTFQLAPIEGSVPDPYNRPGGCPFHPRCTEFITGKCNTTHPDLLTLPDGRRVRCLLYGDN